MKRKQLERLREELLRERQDLQTRLHESEHDGLAVSMNDSIGELSGYDNHPADVGTELYERGKDIALNEQSEKRLREIDEAIDRMTDGTYGFCAECGREIPYGRLKANPTAKYCIEHQLHDDELTGGLSKKTCWLPRLRSTISMRAILQDLMRKTRGKRWNSTARQTRRIFTGKGNTTTSWETNRTNTAAPQKILRMWRRRTFQARLSKTGVWV